MAARILLPRFDTHGDIVLLEGFVEALLALYPASTVTLLVRPGYDQLAAVFPSRLRWHTLAVRPYEPLEPNDGQLERVRGYFSAHQYDLILSTCFSQTWTDTAVGALANPGAYRVAVCGSRGPRTLPETLLRSHPAAARAPWDRIVIVDEDSAEGAKYRVLFDALKTMEVPTETRGQKHWAPQAVADPKLHISRSLAAEGLAALQGATLSPGGFVLCCPAGVANIGIKRWSAERFADVIAWLEEVHRLPTLLVGHASERPVLDAVCALAQARGAWPRLWIGQDGQLARLAALTNYARLYLGNDTGPMHLAAALNVPAVAIFGGGHWPRFVPAVNTTALARELLCFGCGWECLFADALCIRLVPTEDVRQAVDTVLREVPPPYSHGSDQDPDRSARPSSIARLETRLDVEPMGEWLAKAERLEKFRPPPPVSGLLAAVARRLRSRRDS